MGTATPAASAGKVMTSDELFALRPSKKVDRWLFRGELRESKVTKRNPSHSETVASVCFNLKKWLLTRPQPRGKLYAGEVYFRIRTDPDTNVGIDVALSGHGQEAKRSKKASYVEGPPVLAAEVLSPYDKVKEIDEMVEEYLACGVKLVWVLNPNSETVTVFRPNELPVMLRSTDTMTGGDELPGFECKVAELFE